MLGLKAVIGYHVLHLAMGFDSSVSSGFSGLSDYGVGLLWAAESKCGLNENTCNCAWSC